MALMCEGAHPARVCVGSPVAGLALRGRAVHCDERLKVEECEGHTPLLAVSAAQHTQSLAGCVLSLRAPQPCVPNPLCAHSFDAGAGAILVNPWNINDLKSHP